MNQTTHAWGANAPPPPAPLSPAEVRAFLDYALEQLLARREELIGALAVTAKTQPISGDEELGLCAENVRMARALVRTAEDRRAEHKRPFLDGGRAVDGWFKAFFAPLDAAIAPVQQAMDLYGQKKLAAERARREAEARAAAEAAEQAAAKAAAVLQRPAGAFSHGADEALEEAAQAAEAAAKAEERASARAAALTRTSGVYGAVASMRTTWGWRLTDIAQVPREYLCVDTAKVRDAAKRRDKTGKPVAVIPGIEWVPQQTMGVR